MLNYKELSNISGGVWP
ncbi:MAG: bacteriocin [Bacteroidales bacterium]